MFVFYSPGGGPQSCYQSLQEPSYEDKGVLSSDDEVKSRQNQNAMNQQANNDCDGVHAELASHLSQVIHFHDLSCY